MPCASSRRSASSCSGSASPTWGEPASRCALPTRGPGALGDTAATLHDDARHQPRRCPEDALAALWCRPTTVNAARTAATFSDALRKRRCASAVQGLPRHCLYSAAWLRREAVGSGCSARKSDADGAPAAPHRAVKPQREPRRELRRRRTPLPAAAADAKLHCGARSRTSSRGSAVRTTTAPCGLECPPPELNAVPASSPSSPHPPSLPPAPTGTASTAAQPAIKLRRSAPLSSAPRPTRGFCSVSPHSSSSPSQLSMSS
jgi:hypothetical protein